MRYLAARVPEDIWPEFKARAQAGAIRLRLLKIGAVVIRNTRRISLHLSTASPDKVLFHLVATRLKPG